METKTAAKAPKPAKKPAAAKAPVINIGKGRSFDVEAINAQLVRLQGKAGNLKSKVSKTKPELLTSIVELTGDSTLVLDERSIAPLVREGVIDKAQATEFRAYARLAKALEVITAM